MDGAIHRRGGPAILAACRELRASRYLDGLPAGQAVATTAGELPARWVIHTVGPVYSAQRGPLGRARVLLRRIAAGRGRARGADGGLPGGLGGNLRVAAEDAARIALTTVSQAPCQVGEARFVLFTPDMHAVFARVHAGLEPS